MARTYKKSLRHDADYTEDTVGFAIEAFLTLFSFPYLQFSIEPFSRSRERWLGADARLDGRRIRGFRPFYMQFKRPSAYPDSSTSQIVKQRRALTLSVTPRSLFFSLRDKKPNHRDYQHNILFRLRQRLKGNNLGDATYICPLFLDRSAYRFHMHLAGLSGWLKLWHYAPWELEDILINHGNKEILFEHIPVLSEHISIPPHDIVNNSRHHYSFDESGKDLCFHSPKALPEGASTLAAFLKAVGKDFFEEESIVTPNSALENLKRLFGSTESEEPIVPDLHELDPEEPIGNWLFCGEMLRREYGIEQYAFISWKDL